MLPYRIQRTKARRWSRRAWAWEWFGQPLDGHAGDGFSRTRGGAVRAMAPLVLAMQDGAR